ncbi:MFS transporter [Epidermidibacterium keratini]|uniref:MFS transporter n=1 Tax=Epidermidibacterium keratini TaxID=1891644 RepID=A0A7L4YMS1_9ACTN|nr:aromatic acid/H+ symport family MFS transporter [Epidermidibacterium keratini]QHC00352.1 MFS transporter [Epidermidibacterium keratini]
MSVTTTERRSMWPAALCWITVMLEGYDLVVLGAVIPTLVSTEYAGINVAGATTIATLSLVGVAIGAAMVGPLTDRFGRRIVLLGSIALFSIFTLLIPMASSVAIFAAFRLIAGLGLGACMPTALTYMSEFLPPASRAKASTWTMTGYHVGAVLTSLLALAVIPNWQPLFYAGGIAGLLILPIMWAKLPESEAFLQAKKTSAAKVPLSMLLKPPYLRATIAVWVGSFMGLLLVYGLNTWLPKIMEGAGYPLDSAITMLLVLNVGAVVGLLLAGWAADRKGIKPVILLWFALSAVLLALLSVKFGNTLLLNLAIFVTGVFVFSGMVLIYAYVTHAYPPAIRGTALGLASAVGRLGAIFGPMVTGALVAAGLGYPWGFYFFAAVAVLGLVAMFTVPRSIAQTTEQDPALTS